MSRALQERIVESLNCIGEFVTIEELRQRGNIAPNPAVVMDALMSMQREGRVKQIDGARWGLRRWDVDSKPKRSAPSTGQCRRRDNTGKRAPGETRAMVKQLRDSGYRPQQIANELGVSSATVSQHLRRIERDEGIGKQPQLPDDIEDQVYAMRSSGKQNREIAKHFGIDLPKVRELLNSALSKRRAEQPTPEPKEPTMTESEKHPALRELEALATEPEPPTIEDAETKLEALRLHAAFLAGRGADEACDLILEIHNDLAAITGLDERAVDIVAEAVKRAQKQAA